MKIICVAQQVILGGFAVMVQEVQAISMLQRAQAPLQVTASAPETI